MKAQRWLRLLRSYLELLWLFRARVKFTLALLEAFPDWFAFVENHKILGWLSLFLFSIAIYCFTAFVSYNCQMRLTNLKPWTSRRELCVCVFMCSKLQALRAPKAKGGTDLFNLSCSSVKWGGTPTALRERDGDWGVLQPTMPEGSPHLSEGASLGFVLVLLL